MKFAIQIGASAAESNAPMTGLQFIKAALDSSHRVVRVFFYHDGVYNAFMPPRPGELPVPDWSSLASGSDLELVFCSTAAERRGLLNDSGKSAGLPPLPGFRPGGLGLWVDACLRADRVIQFGA